MTTPVDARHVQRDRGTALLLTIGFVVMIGAISAGLAGLVTSGLNNTVTLQQIRDRQYAADGAIERAIAEVRSTMGTIDMCLADAGGTLPPEELNQVSIRVDWSSACGVAQGADGLVFLQRDIVFTACLDAVEPCDDSTTIIGARVNFEQRDAGPVRSTVIQSWSVDR